MNKEAFLSKILNPSLFSRAGQIAASDTAALKAFDKAMMGAAKKGVTSPASKAMGAYTKYFMGPAHIAPKMAYGKKADMAKLLGIVAGSGGAVRYGGEAARPLYNSLSAIANKINPEAMEHLGRRYQSLDTPLNLMKPGLAITSKPAVLLDKALGGVLHAAEHPIISSFAAPLAIYGGIKGGSALLSRLGRMRRLNLLRKGIAPKAYRSAAQRIGFQ